MNKIEILKKAGITSDFDMYEVEETEKTYRIFRIVGDILGCILVGKELIDINNDKELDVTASRATLDKILELSKGNIDSLDIGWK